jgi:hypothetical protein
MAQKHPTCIERMRATGIGFAGIEGAWWRPACQPFPLPAAACDALREIARALFALFDVLGASYGYDPELTTLLDHKAPAHLRALTSRAPVLSVRPDFQLCDTPEGGLRLIATELEMCPAAHGFAHAMQVGYGLESDLARAFVQLLDGRELLMVGTQQWSEFLSEQLAFCRALAEHGARARVTYDLPLETLAREFRAGARWQPPMFGVRVKPAEWNDDLLARLQAHDLLPFWRDNWAEDASKLAVFRFGYLENFSLERLAQFQRWEAQGARFLNPATFYLDSKATLAAARLPSVRAQLGPAACEVLDRCLPETVLLTSDNSARFEAERGEWVLKFSGYDAQQQAWGGRSLQIGAAHTRASWAEVLRHYAALPFPVVAQRVAHSRRVNIAYFDAAGATQHLTQGFTRLRTFLFRGGAHAGSHLTVTGGTMQVSETTDSVQAPIQFL